MANKHGTVVILFSFIIHNREFTAFSIDLVSFTLAIEKMYVASYVGKIMCFGHTLGRYMHTAVACGHANNY